MTSSDPVKYLPIGVQKSYLLLPKAEREILNTALEQYQPGQQDPILVGGGGLLKTALQLMSAHRLKIDGIDNAEIVYTRWIESVQVRGENQEVYLTFSPRFKRIWLQAKKRMPDHVAQNSTTGMRSKYALCLYGCGRVGTGFTEKLLRSLHSDLGKIQVESCPFFNVPTPGRSRWDPGLTPTDLKRCHWVRRKLVCQVKFTEWTRDDRLRQPVFLGLREDKSASEVVREKTS